jgi:hypothetical protein
MNWSKVGHAKMPAERARVVTSYKAIREELARIDQANHEQTKAHILEIGLPYYVEFGQSALRTDLACQGD